MLRLDKNLPQPGTRHTFSRKYSYNTIRPQNAMKWLAITEMLLPWLTPI